MDITTYATETAATIAAVAATTPAPRTKVVSTSIPHDSGLNRTSVTNTRRRQAIDGHPGKGVCYTSRNNHHNNHHNREESITMSIAEAVPTSSAPQSKVYRTRVRVTIIGIFKANIGKAVSLEDIVEQVGCNPATVSTTITRLINNGWEFAKPTRDSFVCLVVGSERLVNQGSVRRPNGAHVRGAGNPAAKALGKTGWPLAGSEALAVGMTDAAAQRLVDEIHEVAAVEFPLKVGGLLEIIHVSRIGTVLVEDEAGTTYTVSLKMV